MKKIKWTCRYCKEPIERTDRALAGWQHIKYKQVMCLLDATPERRKNP